MPKASQQCVEARTAPPNQACQEKHRDPHQACCKFAIHCRGACSTIARGTLGSDLNSHPRCYCILCGEASQQHKVPQPFAPAPAVGMQCHHPVPCRPSRTKTPESPNTQAPSAEPPVAFLQRLFPKHPPVPSSSSRGPRMRMPWPMPRQRCTSQPKGFYSGNHTVC